MDAVVERGCDEAAVGEGCAGGKDGVDGAGDGRVVGVVEEDDGVGRGVGDDAFEVAAAAFLGVVAIDEDEIEEAASEVDGLRDCGGG